MQLNRHLVINIKSCESEFVCICVCYHVCVSTCAYAKNCPQRLWWMMCPLDLDNQFKNSYLKKHTPTFHTNKKNGVKYNRGEKTHTSHTICSQVHVDVKDEWVSLYLYLQLYYTQYYSLTFQLKINHYEQNDQQQTTAGQWEEYK